MAVSVVDIGKTKGFECFHFFMFFVKWVSRGWFWVSFLCLLMTLGTLFLIFEGVGSKLAIIGFFRKYSECLQGHGGDITRG